MFLTKAILHTTDTYIKKLKESGIETVMDLLAYFPRDIEDKSEVITRFSTLNIREKQVIRCRIELILSEMTRNKKLLIKAVLTDADGSHAEAVWFNRKYLLQQFAIGDTVLIYGTPKYEYGRMTFPSCEIEHVKATRREIVPVYSDLNYIPGTWIREKILLLQPYISDIADTIPSEICSKKGFHSRRDNIMAIHFPRSLEEFDRARIELGYEELFHFQKIGLEKKHALMQASQGRSRAIPIDTNLMKTLIDGLPFSLTDKQKIVLWQILKDMEGTHAMTRMLQGDVGTGKTVVAMLASVHAILVQRKKHLIPSPSPKREGNETMHNSALGSIYSLAQEMRKNPTETEDMTWQLLRNGGFFGLKFRRQHPFSTYIADFYCHEVRVVIEIDGKIHEYREEYDENRDMEMKEKGINVFRFTNEEVLDTENFVKKLEKVLAPLSEGEGVGVRKTPLSEGEGVGVRKTPLSEGEGVGGEASLQVAIMAPTEILARQHFAGHEAWLMELGIRADLLVGSLTPRMKEDARARLKSGETDIIFGTHALIQDSVQFARLGFVVVDEQHRFGVEQRKALEEYISQPHPLTPSPSEKGNQKGNMVPKTLSPSGEGWGEVVPHRLNMSATPIPRSLALTIYGDQDISVLNEYPKGRLPIHTRVVREDQRTQMYRWITEEVRNGRQVYWISPLVEESETLDIASATNMQAVLSGIFPDFSIGLIHGKMSGKEKDRIMQEFYENKIQILSSTSVVEVGVNNPNATIMCIEAAERFGLSSLHQFRGRVGRGEYQSYCYLFTTKEYKSERLRAMEQTNDGFELSEIDLELRGPGEVYGLRQSGVPDFHFADLRDTELISEIRGDIEEWMKGIKKETC